MELSPMTCPVRNLGSDCSVWVLSVTELVRFATWPVFSVHIYIIAGSRIVRISDPGPALTLTGLIDKQFPEQTPGN